MQYKIHLLVLRFKSPLLKPKLKLNWIFFEIIQNSYKSFNKKFFYQHDIKVALQKYVWQNWPYFGCPTWWLQLHLYVNDLIGLTICILFLLQP
jgi:hypothetical protein